jgi:NADPH:quinone reductase-like Zn-dependent oxidoreductase
LKAATCRTYGPPEVLQIEDVPMPSVRTGDVLVRVHASTTTSGDIRLRACKGAGIFWLPIRLVFGVLRPRNPIPGMEFAGTVAAIGEEVTTFKVGDPVFGMTIRGANAEFVAVRETGAIAAKPDRLDFASAAAVPFGALSALVFLRDFAKLQAGERVLINGASGAVGVFAIQLAKHFGAHVTAVCSGKNAGLAWSLGADAVIDYTASDFTKSKQKYDVILDTMGNISFARSKRVLSTEGRHVFLVTGLKEILQSLWTSLRPGKRVIWGTSGDSKEDLMLISTLIALGELKPVIDRSYALDEITDAHRYVETGRKRGSVVISISPTSGAEDDSAARPTAA